MTKWKYGNAWEKYSIKEGEIWQIDNDNFLSVHNIFNSLPDFMYQADMVVTDPPWNLGNINSFYTKAERDDHLKSFDDFTRIVFKRIYDISPNTVYIEIGNQYVNQWYEKLAEQYLYLQKWPVLYYKKYPTNFIRGSKLKFVDYDFTGIDEAKCIDIICKIEAYDTVADLCMGLGLVGEAAYDNNKNFVGTELNKRRLANLMQKLAKKGAKIERLKNEKE